MVKMIQSPFNMEEILRADLHLYEVWKRKPFIFDFDAYGEFCVKMIDPETMGEIMEEWEI